MILSAENADASVAWTSGNESVVTVENGMLTAAGVGETWIMATLPDGSSAGCKVVVTELPVLAIPAGTTEICEEAFAGMKAVRAVILPEGMEHIGSRAFAGCENIVLIYVPDSVIAVAEDAFDGCTGITVYCMAGGAAEALAQTKGWNTVILN